MTDELIARGRDAIAGRSWADAFAQLQAADTNGAISAAALNDLAVAAYITMRLRPGSCATERPE